MSDSQVPMEIFNVFEMDEDEEDEEALVGEAEYAADGTLRLTGGDTGRANYLQGVFARVNAKPAISLKTPPAPGEEDAFALGATTVARGEDGFLAALQEYLMTYYGLRLG